LSTLIFNFILIDTFIDLPLLTICQRFYSPPRLY